MSVSVLGCTRIATHARMMARSGYMHTAPIRPVNVWCGRCGDWRGAIVGALEVFTAAAVPVDVDSPTCEWRTLEGSVAAANAIRTRRRKRDIVPYAHLRTQGSDRPAPRAAGSVSVLQ